MRVDLHIRNFPIATPGSEWRSSDGESGDPIGNVNKAGRGASASAKGLARSEGTGYGARGATRTSFGLPYTGAASTFRS